MPLTPSPKPPLFIKAVKDMSSINTFKKLLKMWSKLLTFRLYNTIVSIWSIKAVSPLTAHIWVVFSIPARRPWCSNSHFPKELRHQAQLGNQAFWWFVNNSTLTSPDWLKCDWLDLSKNTWQRKGIISAIPQQSHNKHQMKLLGIYFRVCPVNISFWRCCKLHKLLFVRYDLAELSINITSVWST